MYNISSWIVHNLLFKSDILPDSSITASLLHLTPTAVSTKPPPPSFPNFLLLAICSYARAKDTSGRRTHPVFRSRSGGAGNPCPSTSFPCIFSTRKLTDCALFRYSLPPPTSRRLSFSRRGSGYYTRVRGAHTYRPLRRSRVNARTHFLKPTAPRAVDGTRRRGRKYYASDTPVRV